MDPYEITSRLRRFGKKLDDAYWRFDDRAQLALSTAFDKFEAREPMTKWYEIFLYSMFWLCVGIDVLLRWLARSAPARAWKRREEAKRELWRIEYRQKLDREDAAETAREERQRREVYRFPATAPKPQPVAVLSPEEAAAAAEIARMKRDKHFRDIAERDWNARNVRLSDAKYWDDPSDPRRWYNPPFPG
jgi:hypothetical protein